METYSPENFGSFSHTNTSISKQVISSNNQDEIKINESKNTTNKTNTTKNNYQEFSSSTLHSDFQNLYKKFENCDEEEKDSFRKILNVFAILLECQKKHIAKLYQYKSDTLNFIFNFCLRGKTKDIALRKEKGKKFIFFEFLYKAYKKFIKTQFIIPNTILDFNDILYDVFGLPIVECELTNKIVINKMITGLKTLNEYDDCLLLLVNDQEFESSQFCYQILSTYELNKKVSLQEYVLKNGETNEDLHVNPEENNEDNYKLVSVNNTLLKLRKFNVSVNLKTLYDYHYLLEDRNNDLEECKELYPTGKSNYTYISIGEIFNTFTRMIVLEDKKFEQHMNGKFIKCKRDDNIIEFKSRWIYSFNVTTDNVDLTIGIHQRTPNSTLPLISYLYIGLVILKSNMSLLNFVDYLPLKDVRQNFIKLKLSKGSYVVVPITSGFYFGHPREPKYEIDKIPLIENTKNNKTNKVNYDFSQIAKNIIDEIFDKFDVNNNGFITLDELIILYEYAIEIKDDDYNPDSTESLVKQLFKNFLDEKSNLNLKGFRNFFFFLVKTSGEQHVYKIFKKFGYDYIMNYSCRNFFMTFDSNEALDIKLSDGLNTKFNSYAFELYLKHVGKIMNTNNNKYINLLYDQSRDNCNIMLMLENKSDNEKKVTFNIDCTGYISLNGFDYKNVFKPKESKFLFAIAIDKVEKELSQQSLWIKYHIMCE